MNILVPEAYSANALAKLQSLNGVKIVATPGEAEILMIRSKTRVDKAFLERAPRLKFIVTSTSGFDHIDWRECNSRKIVVTYTPNANAQSTAELTLMLMLAFERRLIESTKNVRGNKWREGLHKPRGLEGQDLGIVGLGRVGRKVTQLAQAFGMNVSAYDPYIEAEVFKDLKVERMAYIEILKANDYVSLHVPLTSETKYFLNFPTFNEMQAEAVLVNTCRGPVVDENALMTALDEGTIRGAAMDVLEREPPPPGHRIMTHPKLLLTPHIGAFTENAWDKASFEAVEKVFQFMEGRPVLDTLPLPLPWFEKTLGL